MSRRDARIRGALALALLLVAGPVLASPQNLFVRRDSRASLAAPVSDTAQLYALHCAGCHRFDGRGQPSFGVPSMVGVIGRFLRAEEGRDFLVQVPGVNNAGLSDAQIAELTNWMVRRFGGESTPVDWRPFTAEELPALRARRPDDLGAARRRILGDQAVDGPR